MSAPRRRAGRALTIITTIALAWALWTANTRPDLARSRTTPPMTKEHRP